MGRYLFETERFPLILDFDKDALAHVSFGKEEGLPPLRFCHVRTWLEAFFLGDEEEVPFPEVLLEGTPFELRVWRSLRKIPRGHLMTYGSFAKLATGSSKNARAVGQALGKNPLPILFPCHRVVRGDLSLGGFAHGGELKKALLKREGVLFEGNRVLPREGLLLP